MMTIDRLLEKLDPASPILQATFGLERESLRVTEAGTLASTPHPSSLGSRINYAHRLFNPGGPSPTGCHHRCSWTLHSPR